MYIHNLKEYYYPIIMKSKIKLLKNPKGTEKDRFLSLILQILYIHKLSQTENVKVLVPTVLKPITLFIVKKRAVRISSLT